MTIEKTTEIQDPTNLTKNFIIELIKTIVWPTVLFAALLFAMLNSKDEIINAIKTKSASYVAKDIKPVSIGTHNVCVVVSGTSPKTIVNGKESDVNTHVVGTIQITDIEAINKEVQGFKNKGWSTSIKAVNCQTYNEL